MLSQELIPAPREFERVMEIGARSTDLTLVLNTHGTPADAAVSAEYIPSRSMVFLEGFPKNQENDASFEDNLDYLNKLRINYGVSDERYLRVKDKIITRLVNAKGIEPVDETDFTQHTVELLDRLLDKDCHIQFADYRDTQGSAEYAQIYKDNEKHLYGATLPHIGPNNGIAPAIQHLIGGVRGRTIAHTLREVRAAGVVLATVGTYVEDGKTETLPKNAQGQLSAYLIYGTAHKHSLTKQFESMNVQSRVIEVNPIDEYMYLDSIIDLDKSNLARRTGHTALSALTYRFFSLEEANELTAKSYGRLEFLNSAGKEEQLKFIVTCALAARAIEKEPDEAYSQVLSILRSIMPSPQDYIR